MKIIFGLSRPKTWKPYAALIMWWDGIPFDHAYTKFISNSWDTSFIYQASGSRTNFMSQQWFDKHNDSIEEYELECDTETFNRIGEICVKREGIPYGIKQTFGKAIVCIVYLISKKKIKNPLADPGAQDCIEEQAEILRDGCGVDVPLDMSSITVKPYRDWLASIPQLRRIK